MFQWRRERGTVRGLFCFYFEVKLGNPNLKTLLWLSTSSGALQMRHGVLRISSGLVKPPELSLCQGVVQTVSLVHL